MAVESLVAPRRALIAVVGLALGLRLVGLGFGLPAVYNPDEIAILSRALAFGTGDLNPHNFLYPTFFFYVLFAWIGAYFVLARLAGAVSSLEAFQSLFFTDPSAIYLVGRGLGALAGTLTVVLIYRLGARLWNPTVGLVAAVALAVAPLHVRDSHYIKHDVPVTLLIVVAYLTMAALRERGGRPAWGAGAATGMAFATHYYAVFLAAPLLVAVGQGSPSAWRSRLRRGLVAAATAAITFALLSPFVLVEPATAWRDIAANRAIVVDRALGSTRGVLPSAEDYLLMLWRDAMGWPVVAAAALGGVLLLRADPGKALWLGAFPLTFGLFISHTVAASRYLNPLLPFVALLAGFGLVEATRQLPERLRATALACTVALVCLPGLSASVRTDLFFRTPDTRTLAREWIEANVPEGATVLVQPYSVPLQPSRAGLREALTANLGDVDRASIKFQLQLAAEPYPTPAYRLIFLGDGGLDADKIYVNYREVGGPRGLDVLYRRGVHYAAVTRYNTPAPETRPFLAALARSGRRLVRFSPYRSNVPPTVAAQIEPFRHNTDARLDPALARPGPVIEVWRLAPARATAP